MRMRICDLHTGLIKLTKAAKRLREQWELTKPHWSDQNARDFEQDYLQSVAPQLTITTAAVNRLATLLERAQRDCSESESL